MALSSDIFLARAEQCERDAQASNLPMVREQLMRAAKIWRDKYDKALEFEANRATEMAKADLYKHVDLLVEQKLMKASLR